MKTYPKPTLTYYQQRRLFNLMRGLAYEGMAGQKDQKKENLQLVKSVLNDCFEVESYKLIPSQRYNEARLFITELDMDEIREGVIQ